MSTLSDLRERLRAFIFRAREERELDEELRFHLQMETEANLRRGLSPEEKKEAEAALEEPAPLAEDPDDRTAPIAPEEPLSVAEAWRQFRDALANRRRRRSGPR